MEDLEETVAFLPPRYDALKAPEMKIPASRCSTRPSQITNLAGQFVMKLERRQVSTSLPA